MPDVVAFVERIGIAAALAVLSFIVGLILSAFALSKRENDYYRLAGTFLLIMLALFANNLTVYAISTLLLH